MSDHQIKISETCSVTLDLARVVAAQLVVVGHGIAFAGIAPWLQPPSFIYIQSMAVVVFFILSGILTSYSIFRKISKQDEVYSFRAFFIERFSRIYNVYAVALFFVLVLDTVSIYYLGGVDRYGSYNLYDFVANFLMLQDSYRVNDDFLHTSFFGSSAFGTGRPLWTLAPEWWMYMFFGFYMLNRRITKNKILNKSLYYSILIPFAILASVKYTLVLAWMAGVVITLLLFTELNRKSRHRQGSGPNRIPSRIRMRLIAPLWNFITNPSVGLIFSGFCFAAGILRGREAGDVYDPLFVLWFAGGFLFLLRFANRTHKTVSKKKTNAIRWLSGYTFTLFVTHYTIFEFIRTLTTLPPLLYFFSGFLISNMVAIVIAHFIERRTPQFRDFLLRHFGKNRQSQLIRGPYLGSKSRKKQNIYALLKGFIAGSITVLVLTFANISLIFCVLYGIIVAIMIGGTQLIINKSPY